jgi:putative copper resistance protein D
VHIAATLFAAGTVCFAVLVLTPACAATNAAAPAGVSHLRRRLIRLILITLAIAILSGAGWLLLLSADIVGAPITEVWQRGGVWQVTTGTRFGQVWCFRLTLALLLGAVVWWEIARPLQLAAAAGLVGSLAWIGHAGATLGPSGDVHLTSDIVHLFAATAWLGALPALVLLLAMARDGGREWDTLAIVAIRRFSTIGLVCVGTLLASGMVNAWTLLGSPGDLISTDYGRLLLLKTGLFAVMIAIAGINRLYFTPHLAARGPMRALQRNSLAETILGVGVLLIVGALGTLPPGGHVHTVSTEIPAEAAFVHIHDLVAMADVTIDPGRTGWVTVKVRLSREDSSLFAVKEVHVALDPPAGTRAMLRRDAVSMPDGTWQVQRLEIGLPGIWTVKLTILPESGPPIVLDGPIVIEQ